MRFTQILLFLPLITLVACGQEPAAQQAATVPPTATVAAAATHAEPSATATIPLPTATAMMTATTATTVTTATPQSDATETSPAPTATAAIATVGRTEEGAYFIGRADAPVTILDYSDFL
jgi:hypothetical protein